jgi:hypothetical protein
MNETQTIEIPGVLPRPKDLRVYKVVSLVNSALENPEFFTEENLAIIKEKEAESEDFNGLVNLIDQALKDEPGSPKINRIHISFGEEATVPDAIKMLTTMVTPDLRSEWLKDGLSPDHGWEDEKSKLD